MKVYIKEKRFGDKVIFNDSQFSVPAGSRTAILGPSGVGKTTLMRIMAGLDNDFSGSIEDGPSFPVVLFQEDRLSERISVLSNLLAVTKDREKAEHVLSELALSGEEKQHIHELSGGMRQRALTAIAMAPGPELLVADEITSSLDASLRSGMLSLLESIDASLIVISHDKMALEYISDRILYMEEGRLHDCDSRQPEKGNVFR